MYADGSRKKQGKPLRKTRLFILKQYNLKLIPPFTPQSKTKESVDFIAKIDYIMLVVQTKLSIYTEKYKSKDLTFFFRIT